MLSPTHLHEFKSPDRVSAQTPVMSLYLPEQRLGSHSNPDSSSHKFMLKGRQSGGMHRGHAWVFRAETRDTMLAWFEDIKNLTEKTGMERDAFVRKHARSLSQGSTGAVSVASSDGALDEDEADRVPYSARRNSQMLKEAVPDPQQQDKPQRPQPGGRFPSDINVDHHLQTPLSPSSGTSSSDHEAVAAAATVGMTASRTQTHAQENVEAYELQNRSYHDEPYLKDNSDLYTSSQPALVAVEPDQAVHSPTEYQENIHTAQADGVAATDMQAVVENSAAERQAAPIVPEPQQKTAIIMGEYIPPSAYASPPADQTVVVPPEEVVDASEAVPHPAAIDTAIIASSVAPNQSAPVVVNDRISVPVTPTTIGTTLSDPSLMSTDEPVFGTQTTLERPPLSNQISEQTISNLHVPGEFPGAGHSAQR